MRPPLAFAGCAQWTWAQRCTRHRASVRSKPGMVVNTESDGVKRARHTLVELLMSDHPSPCAREQQSGDCELEALAKQEKHNAVALCAARRTPRGQDDSSLTIAVDFDACILVRPLHPRLQRHSRQFRSRPHGQRSFSRNRF